MNPFANTQNTSGDKIGGEQDRLGGFQVHNTDVYPATIKLAYAGVSAGGANSMTFEVELDGGGKYSWTEWVTSGTAKGCLPYFEKDGEKQYLPGFNRANAISLMTTGKELGATNFEEKMVKLYNSNTKTEVPTPTKVAVDMIGKKILLGIIKIATNKQAATGNLDANGKKVYADTNEVREINEVDKVFHYETRRTLQEAMAKVETAVFIDQWLEANKGKIRDKFKKVEGGAVAGAPAGGSDAKPSESLFS